LYGDTNQFLCQLLGAGVNIAWAFGATFITFKIVSAAKSMRVTREAETEGLDVPEFGGLAYPEDVVTSATV
jgi:Amt family ammonium transporter